MSAVPAQRWRPARSAALKYRAHDLYETPACAVRSLLRAGELGGKGPIWEPCAGRGAISRELWKAGFEVKAQDLVAYPGADKWIEAPVDFFAQTRAPFRCTIVTNPPFMHADRFVRHALSLGLPVLVLLRLMALEGAGRSDLIDRHLRRVWLGIERLPTMHREGWTGPRTANGGAPFGWFVFGPDARQGPIELNRMSWREGSR